MARLSLAELEHIRAVFSRPECQYCQTPIGVTGVQTVADLMTAISAHKAQCAHWPAPRPRTAQCRPMAGQMAIPLPE